MAQRCGLPARLFVAIFSAVLAGCTTSDITRPPQDAAKPPESVQSINTTSPNKRADTRAAPPPASCYASHMGQEPWLAQRMASTVLLLVANDAKTRVFATGWIVARSGAPGGMEKAIITAGHAVSSIKENGLIGVISSSGQVIGWAGVDARGREYVRTDGILGTPLTRGDIAVIRMRGFARGGADLFSKMEGIELARQQAPRMLQGVFSSPGGIDGGASGSPVLNAQGQAIGIIVSRMDEYQNALWAPKVAVNGGVPVIGSSTTGTIGVREIRLPERSVGHIEPILDANILARLGPTGQNLTVTPPQETSPMQVVIPAMPQGVCVVYRGTVSLAGG